MGLDGARITQAVRPWLSANLVSVSGDCNVTIPTSLIPFIVGALEEYRLPDMWVGDDTDVVFATKVFSTLIAELSAVINTCNQSSSNGNDYSWEGDMSSSDCCTPFKWEDGVLSYKNKCGEWQEIAKTGIGTSGKDVLPDTEPETPEAEVDLRCLKANVVADAIWKVSEAIRDCIDDTLPWQYIGEVEKRAGMQLDTPGMLGTWATYWSHKLVLADYLGTTLDETKKSEFICKFEPLADGGTSNISDKEMDRIHSAMAQTMGVDVIATGFFENVILAISKPRFQSFVNMSVASGAEFECPCSAANPDDEIPVASTWSKVFDFTLGTYGWNIPFTANQRHVMGVGFVCDSLDGGAANFPMIQRQAPFVGNYDASTFVKYIKIFAPEWGHTEGTNNWVWAKVGGWEAIKGYTLQGQPELIGMNSGGWETHGSEQYRMGDGYWYNQSGSYRFVFSKLIMAGDGEDRWSQLNPDGTWGQS